MKAEDLSKFKSASKLQTFQVYHYFNNPESYSNRLCYDSIRGLCDALPLLSYSEVVPVEERTYNVKQLVVGSRMTLNAYKIDTIAPRVYELSGDVSHFGVPSIRFYGTKVRVDMREELTFPIISGNGQIYYPTKKDANDNVIYGIFENKKIIDGEFSFLAKVNPTYYDNGFTTSWSYKPILNAVDPIQTDIEVYGFPIEITSIGEFPNMNLVTNVGYTFKELPVPFQQVLDYAKDNYVSMKGELLYYHPGESFYSNAFNLNLSSLNMKAFSLQNISLTYNQTQDELVGSFYLSIPGEGFEAVAKQMNLSDNSKIIVINNEDTIESTVAKVNNDIQGFIGSLQLGVIAEFRNGGIDKFVLSIGSKIPIGASGLFITEMTGGVEDFTSDSWKALANVDIETGLDLPIVGSPIKINDFGVKIAPMSEFEGSGSLEVFGSPTANATMAFNFEKGLFHVNSGVNIANILTGTMSATLQRANFKGTITGNIQTPETLPWGLGWAANTKISSVTADIDNAVIHTKGQVWKFTLAQKIEFGNPSFPYIYYSIGRNYDNLYSILKSPGYDNSYSMMKSSTKPFDVPHGAQEIMLVAGTETELIDFSAKSPSGKIYTKNNSEYQNFPAAKQSVMSLKDPEPGKWEVFTDYNADFLFEAKVLNSAPVVFWEEHEDIVVNYPNPTSYPKLNVNYLDYEDTLSIEVFLDSDKKLGDGNLFYSFYNTILTGSGSVEIPLYYAITNYYAFNRAEYGKDYYLYCKVSDSKNEPTYMYAPFTIRKEHSENIYNEDDYPKNLRAEVSNDTVKLSWDNDPRSNTDIYYQAIEKTNISRIVKVDTSFCYIANLTPNLKYKAWAQFSDTSYYSTWHSPISDTLYFSLRDSTATTPLLFSEHNLQLEFIENTLNEYTFDLSSRTNPSISFTYETDSKGIKMNKNILTWTPTTEDIGIHTVKIHATDSVFVNDSALVDSILVDDAYVYMYADTMYLDTIMTDSLEISILVKSREQIASKVKFSAYYILENFVNIVEVFDHSNQNATGQIELYNARTGEHTTISCHKSNGKFYGGFYINSAQANAISATIGDTIWAEYDDLGGEIVKSYAVYARIPMNTSVKEQKVDSDMIISPNPTSNAIEIQLNTISNAKSIKIVNAQGNVVANIPINGEKIIHYSISDFVPGVYVVNVITADKTYSRKIIKI
ncbi:MAG: T9SS type A sorting domain-containing protein [Paludibacteraceae bacterium]|nr:T9SS type A sorting domain-containing protein [Paludibacteraceae bacterium]